MESTAVGIAFDHDFDEGFVDHIHLGFAITIGEIHFFATDDGWEVLKILWDSPVEGDVGEWSLGSPTGWGIDAEDEGLDALLDLFVGKVINLNEWGEISIK